MRVPLIAVGALIAQMATAQSPPGVSLLAPLVTGSAPAARLICTRGQVACAALVSLPVARSLATRERERAERTLERLPMSWQVIYVLVPPDDPQALDELNLLLLAQLIGQAPAAAAPSK